MVATTNPHNGEPQVHVLPRSLRVVRPATQSRPTGMLGTSIALLIFAIMLAVAGIHALSVQTQAEIDAVRVENTTLETAQTRLVAELSWIDSPEGLVELATAAGFVPAAEVINLIAVPEGQLAPPRSADPFGAGSS